MQERTESGWDAPHKNTPHCKANPTRLPLPPTPKNEGTNQIRTSHPHKNPTPLQSKPNSLTARHNTKMKERTESRPAHTKTQERTLSLPALPPVAAPPPNVLFHTAAPLRGMMNSFHISMRPARFLAPLLILLTPPAYAATFGTVVAPNGGASYSDIVLDSSRSLLYLVNTATNAVDVYNLKTKAFQTSIQTGIQPVSAAISLDNRYLYVTAYTSAALDVIDLNISQVINRVALPTFPQGVAVGADGRVLSPQWALAPAPPTPCSSSTPPARSPATATTCRPFPSFPLPPRPRFCPRRPVSPITPIPAASAPRRTANGSSASTVTPPPRKWSSFMKPPPVRFCVTRQVANLSTTLSVSPDGTKFMAGPTLFNAKTLQVMAQENSANAPFAFPSGVNFNTQANEGGSVFSPDGSTIYAAFNFAPIGAAKPSITELLVNDPENLLITLGLQMPENLQGKMVIDSAGANVYAISESGFMILPVSTITQSPLAVPSAMSVLLTNDPCGAFKGTTASDAINNSGKGKFTVSVAGYTPPTTAPAAPVPGFPPVPTPASSIITPAPSAQANNNGATPAITFTYSGSAGTNPGTIGPSDFTVSSTEAINIPGNVHVYQNYRDSVSTGTIVPVAINALTTEGLADIVLDSARQKLYIANAGLNRLEVYDLKLKAFGTPIKVGQLPISMAFGSDGNTLYAANAGGESISVVDLTKQLQTGLVAFPAIPLNVSVPIYSPVAIAVSAHGPIFVMSNGTTGATLWKIDSNTAIPRTLNSAIFGAATTTTVSGGTSATTAYWSLAATAEGNYVFLMTGSGTGYIYSAAIDDFTLRKPIFTGTLTGYRGPVAAGPQGAYYAVGGTFLNASLTPVQGSTNASSPTGRPVAAVTAVSATQVALFTTPTRTSATTAVTDAGLVEVYNPATGASTTSAGALESPATVVIGTSGVSQFARTMAVDPSSETAYALTATGLSIVSLTPAASTAALRPSINPGGVVSLADFTPALASGGLVTIFGKNLGSLQTASPPLPTTLGGMCVTLNNVPIPLELTSAGQINAQIPVTLAAGKYPLVLRSIANQAESASTTVTVAKYAPAVLMAATQPSITHADGTYVDGAHPAVRDEKLFIYATGLAPPPARPLPPETPYLQAPRRNRNRTGLFRESQPQTVADDCRFERSDARLCRRGSDSDHRAGLPHQGLEYSGHVEDRRRKQFRHRAGCANGFSGLASMSHSHSVRSARGVRASALPPGFRPARSRCILSISPCSHLAHRAVPAQDFGLFGYYYGVGPGPAPQNSNL